MVSPTPEQSKLGPSCLTKDTRFGKCQSSNDKVRMTPMVCKPQMRDQLNVKYQCFPSNLFVQFCTQPYFRVWRLIEKNGGHKHSFVLKTVCTAVLNKNQLLIYKCYSSFSSLIFKILVDYLWFQQEWRGKCYALNWRGKLVRPEFLFEYFPANTFLL